MRALVCTWSTLARRTLSALASKHPLPVIILLLRFVVESFVFVLKPYIGTRVEAEVNYRFQAMLPEAAAVVFYIKINNSLSV